jgi:glycerol-3-phosphate acyltransferase PlsY
VASSTSFLILAVLTMAAYLIGGLPFGYWFVRLTSGKDIRAMGSGNIGATNVHRTMGGKAGVIVLVLDIAKGFAAVFIAGASTHNDALAVALAIAAVMIGHCYPVFLGFKGGKAVACFIGTFLYVAPLALLVVLAFFVLVVALSNYISLGSVLAAAVFPVVFWFIYHPALPILLASIFAALLIIYRHKANISRLRSGTEHPFSLKGKAA